MIIQVGKHKGKSVEEIVLKEPDYARWVVQQNAGGPLLHVKDEVQRLVTIFDAKEFIKNCSGMDCSNGADCVSVYRDKIRLTFWCENCDPYQAGSIRGNLQVIKTYSQALSHVDYYCNGNKKSMKSIIIFLARSKGLPSRVGKKQAQEFFEV